MDNLPVKAKEKKMNIFQKIRLALFKRQKFTMERYINAPEYIKTDNLVIYKIVYTDNNNIEENLLQIPESKMLELLDKDIININKFSIEKQVELISKLPDLAKTNRLNTERKFLIIDKAIKNNLNDLISDFYPSFQQEYLRHLKENGRLNNTLPIILKYLDKGNIDEIVRQDNSLLIYLDEKQQIDYIHRPGKEEYFKYINSDIQLQYMQENPKYIELASDEAQEKFTLLDKNNFSKTTTEFQLKTIAKIPKAFEYANDKVKYKVWNDPKDERATDSAISLLKKDIRNSKYLNLTFERDYYPYILKYLKLFNNIQDEDIETIKKYFLHSKMFDAKGNLLPSNIALHGACPEENRGIDDYTANQIDIIHKLNINQIESLVSIDSNYVLPYLVDNGESFNAKLYLFILNEEQSQYSKNRCKELFGSMFGRENLAKINECIDIIYDMQQKENDNLRNASKKSFKLGVENNDEINQMREVENIPLNQLKVIFNKNIIENNSPEMIKAYIEKYSFGQDNSTEFKKLLENAYGVHAREILDSRPGLNVHSINSLEVFDERIIENFGEAFVHDLISYNIRDFSNFLEVIKDENKLENFKIYYSVLTNIMGNNVETMQKAISEYYYNEELLKNVKDVELSDTQYDNLISVLCSENNRYNIDTLQELQKFDEIANEITRKELEKASTAEEIKKVISEHILGLDYEHNYRTRNYGDSFEYLINMYDISSEEKRKELYTDSEFKMLEVINFISKESNPTKLLQIAEELMNEKGARNSVAIYNAVDKMKEHQMEILNDSFLTIDKMEEACKIEYGKESPLITKSIREDGIVQYSLEGIDFTFLQHRTTGFPLYDILNYEGQLGNNAICTRMVHSKNLYPLPEGLGYTNIEKNGIIAYQGTDAGTNHMPKLVRGTATFMRGKYNSKDRF